MKRVVFSLFILLCSCYLQAQTLNFPTAVVDSIQHQIKLPVIPEFTVNVTRLGAKGDSVSNSKPAFDKAMAYCKKHNGGTIIVPRGIYTLNGPIHFVSNVNLLLQAGAKIRFSDAPEHYFYVVFQISRVLLCFINIQFKNSLSLFSES